MTQRTATGQWRWLAELVSEDMGAVRHAEHLSAMLDEWFPDFQFRGWGDPAGSQRSQVDERTALQIMSEYTDIDFRAAPTNDFLLRREAVAGALNRMVDGQPGLLISPACKVTRKGMAGGCAFKRVQIPPRRGPCTQRPRKCACGAGPGRSTLYACTARFIRPFNIFALPPVAPSPLDPPVTPPPLAGGSNTSLLNLPGPRPGIFLSAGGVFIWRTRREQGRRPFRRRCRRRSARVLGCRQA